MSDPSDPPAPPRNEPVEPRASVLLVDDNPANLLALRAVLDDLGHTLVDARSGEDAVRRALADEFAVVLLDVRMPGIGGFEAARRIRAGDRSRHTPVIFLTADDTDRPQIEEAYALGAVDFLVKPLLPVVLRAKVRGFVELFLDKQRARHEADQLRLLVQGTTDYAIFLLDPDGRVATWNPGAERLKGYRADEVVGSHFSRFYPQEALDRGWPAHELRVARSEGRFEDEGWRVRKDGSRFWANVVITALHDGGGSFRGFSKITRDLTERKRAEENARRLVEEATARRAAEESARAVHEERERLHVTLASIGDAVISTDAGGRVAFLNPVAETLVGWTAEDAAGRPLEDVFRIVNEGTRRPVENPAVRALKDGAVVGLANHTVLIARDGTERPIDDSAAPIRDAAGAVIGCVLVFRDVSGPRRAEREVRASEARNSAIVATALDCIITMDHDGRVVEFNPAAERTFGYRRDQVIGRELCEFIIPPALRERHRRGMARYLATGDGPVLGNRLELPALRADGTEFPVELAVTRIPTDGPPLFTAYLRDIGGRKRAERTARFLADASAALAVLADFDGTLRAVASLAVPAFADWAAVDLAEADGSLRRVAVAHADPAKVGPAHEAHRRFPPDPASPHGVGAVLRTGRGELIREITDDLLVRSVGGEDLPGILRDPGQKSYLGVPLKVRGKTLGVITFVSAESGRRYDEADLATAQDLADRAAVAVENAQLYRDLRDADRRKDEFLATLAHELRNPLAPIRNSLHILKMPGADAATVGRCRDVMERQVHQLVRLVDDLLDVSRVMRGKIDLRRERVDLATVVARAVETAQPLIDARGHELTVALPPDPLPLDADPVRLAQVVGNLLTNAAKYTEPNGRIRVTAGRDGGEAVLRVRDTGIGIAPDVLPHVFELFVQADHAAARSQGGLGIGLTLVKNLVGMHGGTVEARSGGPGEGSEFVVRLPLAAPGHGRATEEGDGARADPAVTPSGLRLLVVDDNRDAADTLAVLLQLQGHEVRVAHGGPAALETAGDYRPDVVFLDLGMPGMDGYEVARRLRRLPGLEKVVLAALTGWGQMEDRRRTADAGFDHHLVKPPEPKAVEGVLAERKRTEAR